MAVEHDREVVGREDILSFMECQVQDVRHVELRGREVIGQTLCISIPATIPPRATTMQMGMDSVYQFGAARPQPHVFSISLPSTAQLSLTPSNNVEKLPLPSVQDIGVEHIHHQASTGDAVRPTSSYAYSSILPSSCPRLGRDVETMTLQMVGTPNLKSLCGDDDIHTATGPIGVNDAPADDIAAGAQ